MPYCHVGLPFLHVGSLPFVPEVCCFFEVLALSLSEFFMLRIPLLHVLFSELIINYDLIFMEIGKSFEDFLLVEGFLGRMEFVELFDEMLLIDFVVLLFGDFDFFERTEGFGHFGEFSEGV